MLLEYTDVFLDRHSNKNIRYNKYILIVSNLILQFFDTVGWVSRGHPACKVFKKTAIIGC